LKIKSYKKAGGRPDRNRRNAGKGRKSPAARTDSPPNRPQNSPAAAIRKPERRPMQAEDDDTAQGGTAARHKARTATRHKRGRRPMQTEDDDAA